MKAPIEMSSIVKFDAAYLNIKKEKEEQRKMLRENSVKESRDLVNSLPYTPNLKQNPNDELSRFRHV